MRDLRLVGVHEDGQHLLLSGPEGEQFRVRLDEPLRAAVRRDRPRLGQLQIEIDGGLRPRVVQALIRAGLSAQDVAERSGWSVDKVRRYEGPILAEREYVAGLAKAVRLRGRGGGGTAPTLSARVSQRLSGRGVDPATAEWDSARDDAGGWTVVLTFPAGGRERQARWAFDVPARTVVAVDDEARWLSEEDASGTSSPLPAPHLVGPPVRGTTVYDVEAEGGVQATRRPAPAARTEEPLDLMTAMRERAAHRGRPRRRKGAASQTPVDGAPREDALPLVELDYDPETSPPPPGARGPHPFDEPDGVGADVLPAVPAAFDATGPEHLEEPVEEEPVEEVVDVAVEETGDGAAEAPGTTAQDGPPAGPPADEPAAEAEADHVAATGTDAAQRARATAPQDGERPTPRRRAGRPSVPSWDDVMFGAKPRD
jgi:hypothetical protein